VTAHDDYVAMLEARVAAMRQRIEELESACVCGGRPSGTHREESPSRADVPPQYSPNHCPQAAAYRMDGIVLAATYDERLGRPAIDWPAT